MSGFETDPLLAAPTPYYRAGLQCIGAGCPVFVLGERICEGCLAEAAADCARQFEAQLIAGGLQPRTDELRSALWSSANSARMEWYQRNSTLGKLSFCEALKLRSLTDAACMLVAMGGVMELRRLPGLEKPFYTAGERGCLNFASPDRVSGITRKDVAGMVAGVFGVLLAGALWACR